MDVSAINQKLNIRHLQLKKKTYCHYNGKHFSPNFLNVCYVGMLLDLLHWILARPASQLVLVVKNLPANTGDLRDVGSVPRLGRSPGERNGNPLQYSCLENPMDRGAWQATVHRVAKSQTQLKLSIALDLQKICRYITEFPHMLYPPSPNSNILYNHSTFVKTRKLSVVKSY